MNDDQNKFGQIIEQAIVIAENGFVSRWKKWGKNLLDWETHATIGGLLARQLTLTIKMSESPDIWDGHIAPIVLRSMADVYINIAWIFEAPTERSKKFIEFGLGQEKLFIEHQKKNILEKGSDPEKNDYIKALEGWVDSQCLMFLVEVNIGSWSEMTTRQMAQEANCLDFYRFVYSPFSSGTHSTWQQIAKYNLVQCANPLHKHHLIPHYYNRNENTWDYSYFSNALKYLEKSYRLFDEKTGVKVNAKSSYDFFTKEANCFLSELEKTRVAKD